MMETFTGKAAWVYGDDFDVDYIIGIENIRVSDLNIIVSILMKHYDPDFASQVRPGDILIGGKGFGYCHPHPQAMQGMRELGITTIIAESFAFAFYRSELASGMRLLECPEITRMVERGDILEVTINDGKVKIENHSKHADVNGKPIPVIPQKIMQAGGMIPFLKENGSI